MAYDPPQPLYENEFASDGFRRLDFWPPVFVAFVSSPPGDDEHNGEIGSVKEMQ
jgi:hypothetical protein